jgi:hypothetical protein
MSMTKLTQPAIVAAVLLAGASSAIAHTSIQPSTSSETVYVPTPDLSSPYGGYSPNSPEGQRAYWDYQSRK